MSSQVRQIDFGRTSGSPQSRFGAKVEGPRWSWSGVPPLRWRSAQTVDACRFTGVRDAAPRGGETTLRRLAGFDPHRVLRYAVPSARTRVGLMMASSFGEKSQLPLAPVAERAPSGALSRFLEKLCGGARFAPVTVWVVTAAVGTPSGGSVGESGAFRCALPGLGRARSSLRR